MAASSVISGFAIVTLLLFQAWHCSSTAVSLPRRSNKSYYRVNCVGHVSPIDQGELERISNVGLTVVQHQRPVCRYYVFPALTTSGLFFAIRKLGPDVQNVVRTVVRRVWHGRVRSRFYGYYGEDWWMTCGIVAGAVSLYLWEARNCPIRESLSHPHESYHHLVPHVESMRSSPPIVEWSQVFWHSSSSDWLRVSNWRELTDTAVFQQNLSNQKKRIQLVIPTELVLSETAYDHYAWRKGLYASGNQKSGPTSTSICVQGNHASCHLIVPEGDRPPSLSAFWLFTLCGLTLPYRCWFYATSSYARIPLVKFVPRAQGHVSNRHLFRE